MRTYLLDANVLVDFQLSGELPALAAAAARCDMAVAEQVYDELTLVAPGDKPERVGSKRKAGAALAGSRLRKLEILPGTAEEGLLRALLPSFASLTKKDLGEAASIALAASNASRVFVTGDGRATLWALNELEGPAERVQRVPTFVRGLYRLGVIDARVVRAVATRAASHGVVPTWWGGWLASLPP